MTFSSAHRLLPTVPHYVLMARQSAVNHSFECECPTLIDKEVEADDSTMVINRLVKAKTAFGVGSESDGDD